VYGTAGLCSLRTSAPQIAAVMINFSILSVILKEQQDFRKGKSCCRIY
jgi:hypothetical protein